MKIEAYKLLEQLNDLGGTMYLENDELKLQIGKGRLTPELSGKIKTYRDDLVSFLKSNKALRKEHVIEPVADNESYELSSSQRRLWVLSQFGEADRAYNMYGSYGFNFDVRTDCLERAFKTLIERHEILRTVFRQDEQGQIKQFVLPANQTGFTIPLTDLSDQKNASLLAQQAIAEIAQTQFDLVNGPLLKAAMFKLEHKRFVFCYVMHHIISDAWSMDIILKELITLYDVYSKGGENTLPALRIQYRDYAAWQQQLINGQALSYHKNYWLDQFNGELAVLELPVDFMRPAVKTYHGGSVPGVISKEKNKAFKALCQQHSATLFMGLVALVDTLCYKYSGQTDIVLGTPIAGRQHADLEDQVGFYVNMLALRSRFEPTQGFEKLLEQVRSTTLNAYEHQDYPFDELVDILNLKRDMSRSPLFDVMVSLLNTDVQSSGSENSSSSDQPIAGNKIDQTVSKFDLSFHCIERSGELHISLEYNSDIYTAATAQRMLAHVEQIMDAVMAESGTALEKLNYISESEKQLLIHGFNNTHLPYDPSLTFVNLFEAQVNKTPQQTALVCEDLQFSYQQLNEQANALAHYLAQKGLQTGQIAGICLPRSENMLIAMLAVLKTGAAYLPIAADYPQERKDYLIEDSRCSIVIDETELDAFSGSASSALGPELTEGFVPSVPSTPSDLSHVIYTSGSTGKPKGVPVAHANLGNLFAAMNQMLDKDQTAGTWLALTNFTFDISILELLWTLTRGFKVVLQKNVHLITNEDKDENSYSIQEQIAAHQVTHIQTTPSLAGVLTQAFSDPDCKACIKTVILAGESLPVGLLRELTQSLPNSKVYNMYGPTETTIFSTGALMNPAEKITIGSPIANTHVYILNQQFGLQPVGVPGEIYIGGHGLVKNYLNKPELSQERFINDPFRDGGRLYKTGDLGRWTLQGQIEFFGRNDFQVKVRGHRIELGEIENALLSMNDISAAVVTAPLINGENILVAYFVAQQPLSVNLLSAALKDSLPQYMIPSLFIQLEALPLNASGKIDRRQLPEPGANAIKTEQPLVAPRNSTEQTLLNIWKEILNTEIISVYDNFFDRGGNSIRLIRMVDMARKQLNKKITIITAFRMPNIAALAEYLHSDGQQSLAELDKQIDSSVDVMEETFNLLDQDEN